MREYSRREGSAFKLSPPWCCSATARHPDEPRHSRNTGAGAWCRWGRGGRQRHALSVVELQAEQLGGMRTAKDSAAGLLSAVSQTVVGQPFNTVKVRMQVASGPPLDGPLSLAASILRSEGVGGFYKGIGVNIVKVCGPRHPAPLRAWRLLEPPSPGTAGHPERHDPVHRL